MFLGTKEIIDLQNKEIVISPFLKDRIKSGAYELSLGSEVYLTDSTTGKVEVLNDIEKRQVDINPGQFALLLTKEKISIPKDKIAFISIKAGEKLKGLINVSGFHVDPGFNDHLLFSVYNAGPSPIVLNHGEPYFLIWFAELKTPLNNDEGYNNKNEHYGKLSHIPSKYIEFLKRGELTSPKALLDKINQIDEKSNRNNWLYSILIGVAITIALKTVWDWVSYDTGYNDGRKSKELIEQIRLEAQKPFLDSIVSHKIDSILNNRLINKHDTSSTRKN